MNIEQVNTAEGPAMLKKELASRAKAKTTLESVPLPTDLAARRLIAGGEGIAQPLTLLRSKPAPSLGPARLL